MTTVTRRLDEADLEDARRPRADLLDEAPDGDDRWAQSFGPFRAWSRHIEPDGDGWVETTSYELDIPGIGRVLDKGFRFAVLDGDRTPRRRWYWPEEVVGPLPKVGPDLEIDVDRVAALEPDLVLATLTVPGLRLRESHPWPTTGAPV